MRVPHVNVLKALVDAGQSLTLAQLTVAAGYSEGAGTASRALYGVPEGSSSGPEQTGLLELGYVRGDQIEGESGGRAVKQFSVTARGKKALEEELAAAGAEQSPGEDAEYREESQYRRVYRPQLGVDYSIVLNGVRHVVRLESKWDDNHWTARIVATGQRRGINPKFLETAEPM